MEALLKPHFENGRYYNWDRKNYHHYWQMIRMAFSQCLNYPVQTINAYQRRPQNNQILPGAFALSEAPTITWLGHSMFLIQVGQVTILTDPVFNELPFPFPKPLIEPLSVSHLPQIDIVLISHYHADHFDIKSLYTIYAAYKPLVLVPRHCKQYFLNSMHAFVCEKNWWESFEHKEVTLTFLPAYHWSGISWQTINKSLWGSWMISYLGLNIYFAGDTAYDIHFQAIAQQFHSIDVALMPFGACNTQKEYKQMLHLTPEGFLLACKDLGPKNIIPMHWGMFSFNQDRFNSTKVLQEFWQDGLQNTKLCFLKENESYTIKRG